jgi:hypothetical protein
MLDEVYHGRESVIAERQGLVGEQVRDQYYYLILGKPDQVLAVLCIFVKLCVQEVEHRGGKLL